MWDEIQLNPSTFILSVWISPNLSLSPFLISFYLPLSLSFSHSLTDSLLTSLSLHPLSLSFPNLPLTSSLSLSLTPFLISLYLPLSLSLTPSLSRAQMLTSLQSTNRFSVLFTLSLLQVLIHYHPFFPISLSIILDGNSFVQCLDCSCQTLEPSPK